MELTWQRGFASPATALAELRTCHLFHCCRCWASEVKSYSATSLAVDAPCALVLMLELPAWQALLTESQSQLAAWQPITDAIKSTEDKI